VTSISDISDDIGFSVAVAGFAQLLRGDEYIADEAFDYARVGRLAQRFLGEDAYGYRAEFLRLVDAADHAANQSPLKPGMPVQGR
jgi:Ca-activated chloride channel family protein